MRRRPSGPLRIAAAALLVALSATACARGGDRPAPPPIGDGGPRDARAPDTGTPEACVGVDCTHLDDACTMGVCDPATGACTPGPRADGTTCDDADPCTLRDACAAGACAGEALDCSSVASACEAGSCDPVTGTCVATPLADGSVCDDGDGCTTADACAAGTCTGTPRDCSAMTSACARGTCDAAAGACVATPAPDGMVCDDLDACTVSDRCTAGACGGSPRDCSAMSDACNVGTCAAGSGTCARTPRADGTGCDDGNVCTASDRCTAGACGGTPIMTGGCGSATVDFPIAGDTRVASAGLYFWRINDYVEGTRTTTIPSVRSVDIDLVLELNGLTCDSQDVEMRINGRAVGSFQIRGGDTVIARTFSFAAVTGPSYTLRYHTTRQVGSGCGSSGYSNSGSRVTLRP